MMYATVFLVLVFAGFARNLQLPESFQKCSSKNSDYNECLSKSVQGAIKELISGASQFNLPQLDPIVLPKLQIGAGKGPVNVVQNLENVLLHGYSNVEVTKTEGSFEDKNITLHAFLKNLTLEADYDLNGNILSLPIQGKGHVGIIMTDIKVTHYIQFDMIKKKGEDYLKVANYKLNLDPKSVHYDFSNLFNGNNELRDVTVKAMNDNWEVVFADVKSSYEEAYSIVFKEYANKIFTKVPAKNILL